LSVQTCNVYSVTRIALGPYSPELVTRPWRIRTATKRGHGCLTATGTRQIYTLELDETTTDGGVDKVATTMMTREYFEDLGRIAETNAKSAQQSARIATQYWVASRERNNKVA
jgi:hypothetical protein